MVMGRAGRLEAEARDGGVRELGVEACGAARGGDRGRAVRVSGAHDRGTGDHQCGSLFCFFFYKQKTAYAFLL